MLFKTVDIVRAGVRAPSAIISIAFRLGMTSMEVILTKAHENRRTRVSRTAFRVKCSLLFNKIPALPKIRKTPRVA